MRNIFLLYMPSANAEAMAHYEDTMQRRVPIERLRPHVPEQVCRRFLQVIGPQPVAFYEKVNEVHGFFSEESKGLTVEVLAGRAKLLNK